MKHLAAAKRLIFRPRRFTTIVMMLVIWAGVAGALFAGISTDLRNREYLRGRAQTIADTLPYREIKALKGNTSDLRRTEYRDLKARLQQVRAGNQDLQFVYLMGMKNDQVFFYLDSEVIGSSGYSPPGDKYPEASSRLKGMFTASEPIIDGPTRDRWGVWMSALTPVVDPVTHQVIAVVGIDTPAFNYYTQVLLYALVPLLLSAIPLAGLIRDIKIQSKEYEILQLKNQFVSIASHELRSPLTGMLWAIQSLSRSSSNQLNLEQLGMLSDMYRSTESSLTTVNEILDLSIFERGQEHKLQRDIVDIKSVMKQVAATLKLGASEKQIRIEPIGDWPREVYVNGDVGALKRSFMNIVSNAIKYSPDNSVVELTYKNDGGKHVVGVRDHGIGIPEGEQAKVLEGYYRATNAAAIQAHGTGLGLWVTRKIIEEHGGKVWLESKLNQGTTVFVALPATKASEPPVAHENVKAPSSPSQPKSVHSATQDQGSPWKGKPLHRKPKLD
jgi:signal transduction histidine kinase